MFPKNRKFICSMRFIREFQLNRKYASYQKNTSFAFSFISAEAIKGMRVV